MSRSGNIKKIVLIAIPLIALIIGGVWYFTIYTPQFEAEKAKLLTLYTTADPVDLDPAKVYDTDSSRIIMNVFDRLVKYKRGTTEIEAGLAKGWEIPDTRTYIFNLRDDVVFHDGTKFNSSSVKFSFDRVIEMQEQPSYLFSVINNTEVAGTYKVVVHLNYDFSPFLSLMAHPVASIVSESAVVKYKDNFDKNPVGTGPFKFSSWTSGKELVLVRNDRYFKGPAKLEKIVMKSILESSERRVALVNGDVDVVIGGGILPTDLPDLKKNPDMRVYMGNSSATEYLGFNTFKAPLNDTRVREAISYALDYKTIIEAAYGDMAERISGPIPPTIIGYRNTPLINRDLDKAKSLLTAAGYKDGFEISLTYDTQSLSRRKMAEEIRKSLSDVNIKVNLQGLDWYTAIDEYLNMGHEMVMLGYIPDYFDPDAFISGQFSTYSMAPNGANIFGFSDPTVDSLIEQALATTDQSTRIQIYYQIQDILAEKLPCITLLAPPEYDCVRYNVKNWVHFPSDLVEFYEVYKQ